MFANPVPSKRHQMQGRKAADELRFDLAAKPPSIDPPQAIRQECEPTWGDGLRIQVLDEVVKLNYE